MRDSGEVRPYVERLTGDGQRPEDRGSEHPRVATAWSPAVARPPPPSHLSVVQSHPIRVIAAVIARGDRLLVCRRPPHKRHGGLWEFPGGKCEPGETDADAARRELGEELGVQVLDVGPEVFAINDPGSPFHIAFMPVTIAGAPMCHEHTALVWGDLAELARLPLAPSDRRFVESRLERAATGDPRSGVPADG
jgi:mutator protein MutT